MMASLRQSWSHIDMQPVSKGHAARHKVLVGRVHNNGSQYRGYT
jgi:hypothetical protein